MTPGRGTMRRFSQRNALVTLNEINITPLLDLAFVLLIIFVITAPLLEQSIPLNLPQGGDRATKLDARDVRTVEVTPRGDYYLNRSPMSLPQILDRLKTETRTNPKLVVRIRVDENGLNKHTYAVVDGCLKRGIDKFQLATSPEKR